MHSQASTARAEFISSAEPSCRAEFDYAREDARDLAALATSTASFVGRAIDNLRALNHGRAPAADLAGLRECVADQIEDCLTPEAARLFRAELRAISGEA